MLPLPRSFFPLILSPLFSSLSIILFPERIFLRNEKIENNNTRVPACVRTEQRRGDEGERRKEWEDERGRGKRGERSKEGGGEERVSQFLVALFFGGQTDGQSVRRSHERNLTSLDLIKFFILCCRCVGIVIHEILEEVTINFSSKLSLKSKKLMLMENSTF